MLSRLVVALTFAAVLSSCGAGAEEPADTAPDQSESDADGEDSASDDEAAAEEALTVERGPTCPAVQVDAVAEAFGFKAGVLEKRDLAPGDTYEIPGGGTQQVTNWSCTLQSKPTAGERQMSFNLVIYGDDFSVKERDKAFDESVQFFESNSSRCELDEPQGWGQDGRYRLCNSEKKETRTSFSTGQTTATYDGLFGTTRVACSGSTYPEGGDPKVVPAVDTLCNEALAELAE